MILEGEINDAKMSGFSLEFQTLIKHKFCSYELFMSLRREDKHVSSCYYIDNLEQNFKNEISTRRSC